ncbi:MAG: DNA repair protein RecN [bacterium]|nr:DNA repair protein RecN [bacterium]
MLQSLNIKNIAVIEKLKVDFHGGVTAFTGETGAGKSIIIDSINMILGARTSRELVRYGADRAMVQAVFDGSPEIYRLLEENDIDADDGDIIITRTLTKDGKSSARINDTVVTLAVLREAADKLINIHGQHDNQALLTPEKHINFLDSYAADAAALERYREIYKRMRGLKKKIASLALDEKEKMQRIDLLEYQVKEITEARLIPGEEAELMQQRELLENAEQISKAAAEAYANLYEMEEAQSAYDSISIAVNALSEISDVSPVIRGIYEQLSEAMYAVEDAAHEVRDFASEVEYDPRALEEVGERLDLISRLKKKYGSTIEEINEYGKKAARELASIEDAGELTEELRAELEKTIKELKQAGISLSSIRRKAAKALGGEIEKALSELDMEKAKFSVCVETTKSYEPNGIDRVEFMISTNPGEPLKPLVKIASGGELSRVMLAVKSILAGSDSVGTLIFDEIDTGVSGSAAVKIAKKLRSIGKTKQVICITHLPQMTAAADNHYLIKKNTEGEMASTTLTELDLQGRIEEIARIIDGENASDTARRHAMEMLEDWR